MKREYIILGILVIVIVVAGIAYFALRGAPPSSPQGVTGTLPPVASTTPSTVSTSTSSFPTGSTFQIGTDQGSVTVNNFYKTDAYITQDNETVVLVENNNYTIDYNRDDSGFIIALLSVPGYLQEAQAPAEAAFLGQLGISESDACKLTVDERVLDQTSQYDGDLFGMSFCSSTSPVAQ